MKFNSIGRLLSNAKLRSHSVATKKTSVYPRPEMPGVEVQPAESIRHPSTKLANSTVELLKANVTSFPSISETKGAFTKCFDSFGKSKILLVGDASHGTSEFYAARAEITKYMIEHHGFNIVAVEADWPDAEAVDHYVRRRHGLESEESVDIDPVSDSKDERREPAFLRFPTWMWRNREVQDFVEWLREWNQGNNPHGAVGFYGLDLYSLGTSMRAVINYLDQVDKKMADLARERYGELMTWSEDPHGYGLESLVSDFKGYEEEVLRMLKDLLSKRLEYSSIRWNGEEFHSSEQNARLVMGKNSQQVSN